MTGRDLPNGTFTIESPHGGHRTLRVSTARRGGLVGRRVLSLLVCSENDSEESYDGFGFVEPDGVVVLWARARSAADPRYIGPGDWDGDWGARAKTAAMLLSLHWLGEESPIHRAGYRLLVEERCLRCNRKLTTPESIRAGVGPECAGRTRDRERHRGSK